MPAKGKKTLSTRSRTEDADGYVVWLAESGGAMAIVAVVRFKAGAGDEMDHMVSFNSNWQGDGDPKLEAAVKLRDRKQTAAHISKRIKATRQSQTG